MGARDYGSKEKSNGLFLYKPRLQYSLFFFFFGIHGEGMLKSLKPVDNKRGWSQGEIDDGRPDQSRRLGYVVASASGIHRE